MFIIAICCGLVVQQVVQLVSRSRSTCGFKRLKVKGKPIGELRSVTCYMGSCTLLPATRHKWT